MTRTRSSGPALAVVGATGAVGSVLLQMLSQRADVWGEIRLIASARSAGRMLVVRAEETEVIALTEDAFDGLGPGDIALFLTPAEVSARWAPVVTTRGAVVIDLSAAFREDTEVPLVVPEVNGHAVRIRPRGIVAGPDCVTATMVAALGALHSEYALRDLVVSSYQAASAAGRAAPRRCAASSRWSPGPPWASNPGTYDAPSATTPAPSRPRSPSTSCPGPVSCARTAGPRTSWRYAGRRAGSCSWSSSRCR